MLTAARLGMDFAMATPQSYSPNAEIVSQAEGLAAISGSRLEIVSNPTEAAAGAHAVYTDVWTSMGHEQEQLQRREHFAPYQVNENLMSMARPDAVFMHCLPAKRGEEVTDEVMESPRSIVFEQAENRLHVQKGLLLMVLG
jgi:ornithine carbamoyltransferase